MDGPSLPSMLPAVQGPYDRLELDLPPLPLTTELACGHGLGAGMEPIRVLENLF
jgi:hypothetical protein